MFTTSWEKYPSKPVISSLSAAEAEFRLWLQENHFQTLTDAAGFVWRLLIRVSEGPAPTDRSKPYWDVDFKIVAKPEMQVLVETGTFDQQSDARLLRLLGDEKVPMRLIEQKIQGHKFEQVRMELAETIRKYRNIINSKTFHAEKRKICSRWLNHHQLFSCHLTAVD
ncbi:MAG: hypothetical protein ACOH5I_11125 [Oligoflexus sp.]